MRLDKAADGLVVERRPAALKAGVQCRGGEPKNFQYLSMACDVKLEGEFLAEKNHGIRHFT